MQFAWAINIKILSMNEQIHRLSAIQLKSLANN